MNIRPLHDRLVVRRLEAETTTKGGIVIPDNSAEKPSQGEVIAVGDGALLESGERRPLDLKVGDRVLFSKYGGTEVKLNGETLLVMRESDILAVVEATEAEEKAA
ncbi:co-chaperone GroES [Motiliproteus sediminis]|uniref:co-chaperone GroES n=1 Tax=Motiliproteus sediminis TaxID=1468178 RepID=UPI001AEF8578|nr:co-chaperone GroES [Motiliproteus sediminis]